MSFLHTIPLSPNLISPLEPPQLSSDDVLIFFLDTSVCFHLIPEFLRFLPREEIEQAQARRDYLKFRYIINRAILRLILSNYLNLPPRQITLFYNTKGKPDLTPGINSQGIRFNISHKHDYTIYALSLNPVGIDLEKIEEKRRALAIAKRFFTSHEYEYLRKLNSQDTIIEFFRLWTAKEAYLKAIGEGISGGLRRIDLAKNNQPNWQIYNAFIKGNYLVSVAIKKKKDNYKFQWIEVSGRMLSYLLNM
ncbi:MAG: 4'-phosphopantetheinyl transferase superfamily protein [Geminocystis sp.]|nr:4'-phosphopantetheinyl transferase superfamily protein [Geminocystis sp.]HIK37431.1 4'-phosphopantetheinyl transferase superfamily protein [Geminocystis sp. M7585_C2015_104]MCS7148844.1 4'-phosphopantetheinyl transferase superfamily protein [Geminocystis sp.]MCX8077401.1 4'-phosphopantetheinyl transferase superfamily protein [Geminocystis sp.]MDW8115928.1 4'-phosphopantetheinyl transferase superfamily protein [Geminocystis sp.]